MQENFQDTDRSRFDLRTQLLVNDLREEFGITGILSGIYSYDVNNSLTMRFANGNCTYTYVRIGVEDDKIVMNIDEVVLSTNSLTKKQKGVIMRLFNNMTIQ